MPLSSPDGPSFASGSVTSSSTKTSFKRYSVRSQALARKREAEISDGQDEDTDQDDSEESERGAERARSTKRTKRAFTSPSPLSERRPASTKAAITRVGVVRRETPGARMELLDDHRPDTVHELSSSVTPTAPGNDPHTIPGPSIPAPTPGPPKTPPRPSRRHTSAHGLASSPRDLSSLFSPAAKSSPGSGRESPTPRTKRPGGIRRMLTKAQSLGDSMGSPHSRYSGNDSPTRQPYTPTAPSTPSRTPGRTQSMPLTPTLARTSSPSQDSSFSPAGKASDPMNVSEGRAKRVYGGNRTYLEEVRSAKQHVAENIESPEESMTYAEFRQKYDVDNDGWDSIAGTDASLADLAQARAPLPVSDMRSKGENRRLLDEVGYLVEGVSDLGASLAVRRASSMDILRNMQDESWAAKVHTCGQSDKLWDALMKARGDGDQMIDTMSLLFLSICVQHNIALDAILQDHAQTVIDLTLNGLRQEGFVDSALKTETTFAKRLKAICSELNKCWTSQQVTHRAVCARLLSSIIDAASAGSTESPVVLDSSSIFLALIRVINDELRQAGVLPDRQLAMKSEELAINVDFTFIGACLAVIPLLIVRDNGALDRVSEAHSVKAATLTQLLGVSNRFASGPGADVEHAAADCILETLQILTFFAKSSSAWASAALTAPSAASTLFAIIYSRSRLARIWSHATDPRGTSPTEDGVEGADGNRSDIPLANEEDILCLVLAILVDGLRSLGAPDNIRPVLHNGGPANPRTDPTSQDIEGYLANLFNQYAQEDNKTNAVIRGYIAFVLVNMWFSEEREYRRSMETIEGATMREKGEALGAALRGLQVIYSEEARENGEEDGDDKRAVEEVLGRLKEMLDEL